MRSLMMKIKEKVSNLSKHGLAITITEETLLFSAQEYLKDKEITITKIDVQDNATLINGAIKKMGLPIKFSITIAPEGFNEREVFLRVVEMKPLNNKWLNNVIFNRYSKFISYNDNIIQLNIDALEKVKKVRIGRISNFQMQEGKVVVSIGI
ncbi:MAG: hypothetical protein LRY73_19665 [Bacillus sp. (in: Bacteria)]|nr:hypothetical protein [Bacillus sp. (in: firmicutes)]